MASIEYITKRVEGKEKEIKKLEGKMSRILKAEATDWEVNPYCYNERDKKYTARDLEEARTALADWQAKLVIATEKANSRNVKAILDFLEIWKKNVRDFYESQYPKYLVAKQEWYEIDHAYTQWWNYERRNDPDSRAKEAEHRKQRRAFAERWSFIEHYADYRGFDWERLDRDLKNDANAKYDDIIERTNDIVGEITDAGGLSVGEKGELNGIIIGTRGRAKVHTIGAGGWNIQCFHFRTLIHKI